MNEGFKSLQYYGIDKCRLHYVCLYCNTQSKNVVLVRIFKHKTFEENVVEHCLLGDSEDCVMSDYGKLLIHMLNCTNLIILNGTKAFPSTNVLTCLPSSGGGSVVDYALMFNLACDLSLVNVFKVGSLSLDSDHKPLYLELAIPHLTNRCNGVKDEKRCIIRPSYEKAKMYANEVENHLLSFSLSNCHDMEIIVPMTLCYIGRAFDHYTIYCNT